MEPRQYVQCEDLSFRSLLEDQKVLNEKAQVPQRPYADRVNCSESAHKHSHGCPSCQKKAAKHLEPQIKGLVSSDTMRMLHRCHVQSLWR